MSKIKAQLLSYFQGLPQGAILSRGEVEQALGMSKRTMDRIVQAQEELNQAGIRVVTVTSFIKIGDMVSDQGSPIGSAEQNGVDSAKVVTEDGVDSAKEPVKGHIALEPESVNRHITQGQGPTTPEPEVSLPPGYRWAWHKYAKEWQAVDRNGVIDATLTSTAKAEAPSLDELWESGGKSNATPDDEWED